MMNYEEREQVLRLENWLYSYKGRPLSRWAWQRLNAVYRSDFCPHLPLSWWCKVGQIRVTTDTYPVAPNLLLNVFNMNKNLRFFNTAKVLPDNRLAVELEDEEVETWERFNGHEFDYDEDEEQYSEDSAWMNSLSEGDIEYINGTPYYVFTDEAVESYCLHYLPVPMPFDMCNVIQTLRYDNGWTLQVEGYRNIIEEVWERFEHNAYNDSLVPYQPK